MKKILSLLVLSVLMVGLIAPVMAGAQDEKIKECCVIGQAIDLDDAGASPATACAKDNVAAPDAAAKNICSSSATICGGDKWGIYCLVNVVYTVTNWIFYLMMIGVVILFVIAAAMFMMSSGDAEKTKGAKGMMIYAIIGLVIALVAKLVPSVVKLIVGM
ncbi:MAG: pilin [Candidatus Gribaldobacteria bacterium]|nr:pilin [Candidatus Gribaldobacteria bacterium]